MSEGRKGFGRAVGCLALAGVGLACFAGMGLVLGRHTLVTGVARDELRARGIECDERFALEVALTLDRAVVAPTTCTLAAGAVESIELIDPLTVEVEGRAPTRLEGGAARLALRDSGGGFRPSGWDAILDALSIPERIGTMVVGLGELSRAGAPPIAMERVEVVRGGQPMLTLGTLQADGAAPLAVSIARVELPAITGPIGARATVGLSDVRSTASPERVTMDARLDVSASVPMLGSLDQQREVRVEVDGLGTPAPRWSIR